MAASTNVKIPPEIQEALEIARRRGTRSLAGQILHYIRIGLLRDGYDVPDAPAVDSDEATS